ncbi:MAG TPA: hypothetical protein V6C65_05055 [Allocoleopsis sp.]
MTSCIEIAERSIVNCRHYRKIVARSIVNVGVTEGLYRDRLLSAGVAIQG